MHLKCFMSILHFVVHTRQRQSIVHRPGRPSLLPITAGCRSWRSAWLWSGRGWRRPRKPSSRSAAFFSPVGQCCCFFVFVIKIFRVSYYLAASAFPSIWWPLPPKERLLQRGFFLDKAGSGSKGVGSWPRSPLLEGEVIPQQYQKRLGEKIWRLQKCPRIRHPYFQKATHKVGTLHAWQRLLCPRCCPCCVRCVVGFPSK